MYDTECLDMRSSYCEGHAESRLAAECIIKKVHANLGDGHSSRAVSLDSANPAGPANIGKSTWHNDKIINTFFSKTTIVQVIFV